MDCANNNQKLLALVRSIREIARHDNAQEFLRMLDDKDRSSMEPIFDAGYWWFGDYTNVELDRLELCLLDHWKKF